jgi:hypothetical protein
MGVYPQVFRKFSLKTPAVEFNKPFKNAQICTLSAFSPLHLARAVSVRRGIDTPINNPLLSVM